MTCARGVRGEGGGNKNSNSRKHLSSDCVRGTTSIPSHGPSSLIPIVDTVGISFSQMGKLRL